MSLDGLPRMTEPRLADLCNRAARRRGSLDGRRHAG